MHQKIISISKKKHSSVFVKINDTWKHKRNKNIKINFHLSISFQKAIKKSNPYHYERVFAKLIPFTARVFP